MFPGMEAPKPLDFEKSKDLLSKLGESAVDSAKKAVSWFKELFTSPGEKLKGVKEGLMGALIGFLRLIGAPGKKGSDAEELQALREQIGPSPSDPSESSSEILSRLTTGTAAPLSKEAKAKWQQEREAELREIQLIKPLDHLENLSYSERIKEAVKAAIKMKIPGRHCWNWAEKVYWLAGFPFKGGNKVIFSTVGQYEGRDCGDQCAKEDQLSKIEPGDWLFINNKNESDKHGNHSVIFLGWVDEKNQIAEIAACPGGNKLGKIYPKTNLKEWRVTYISKPVQPISGPGPLIA